MDTADPTASPAPILAIAAEGREFAGLLPHARSRQRLDWPLDYSCEAVVGGVPWILVAGGPGPQLAAQAAAVALDRCRPAAVVSTGLCGALDPSIPPGSIFVATQVSGADGRSFPARLPALPHPVHCGKLISQDRVAVSAAEKATLYAAGAQAVDMEAAAVADMAQRSETPFYCLRVVSDDAHSNLPLDFNRYRDSTGRFSRSRIALAVCLMPTLIPRLIRFDMDCRRSAILLGDTLATCRF